MLKSTFRIFLGLKTIELLAKLGSSHGFYTIFIFIFNLLHNFVSLVMLTNQKHDPTTSNAKTQNFYEFFFLSNSLC